MRKNKPLSRVNFNSKKDSNIDGNFLHEMFYAIEFFDTETGLYRTNSPLTTPPDILVKDDFVYFMFDFTDQKTLNKIKNIFGNLSKGSYFNITDGLYRDENLGIDDISFADSYEFLSFNSELKYIKATKPSSLSVSSKVEKYLSKNFILKPQIDVSSLQGSTPLYGIVNYFGPESSNSFHSFGVRKDDIFGNKVKINFRGTSNNDNKVFSVIDYYIDDERKEVLIFKESTVAENLINTPLYTGIKIPAPRGSDYNYRRQETPGVTTANPGVTPAGPPAPIDPGDRLNRCPACTGCCFECLMRAIRLAETRNYDTGNSGCDAPQTGCDYGLGCDCGPYQIDEKDFRRDICGGAYPAPCNYEGESVPPYYAPECCEICDDLDAGDLCKTCSAEPTEAARAACCEEKRRVSEKSMECMWRRYNRNQDANNPCDCHGDVDNRYGNRVKKCCTCKDLARKHNRGYPRGNCKEENCPDADGDYESWCKPDNGVEQNMRELCPSCLDLEDGEYPPTNYDDDCTQGATFGPPEPEPEPLPVPGFYPVGPRGFSSGDGAGQPGGTPRESSTGPFAIAGYYPLYLTKEAALEASPTPKSRRPGDNTIGYHIHTIASIRYYMPNGLKMGSTQFHGNFPYEFDPNGTGLPFGVAPPSAPSGGGGGGYGY